MEELGGVRGEAARLVSEVGRGREAVMSMQCMCVCVCRSWQHFNTEDTH